MKYIEKVRSHFSKQTVFSIRDLKIFLAKEKISRQYAYLLVHNLLRQKELFRISRGFYSFKSDLEIVGFVFSPFYYGLQNALSIHNLWEQETRPVIITTRKARSGLREIMGGNVLVRRISKKMFFGFELIRQGDYWLPVSSIEKTLVDFAYFKEPLGNQALKEIKQKINKKKLQACLKKTPERTAKTVKKWLKQKGKN